MTLWELLSTSRHTCEMKFTVMHLTFEAGDPATCCRCRGEKWARQMAREWQEMLDGDNDSGTIRDLASAGCLDDLGVPENDEIRREK